MQNPRSLDNAHYGKVDTPAFVLRIMGQIFQIGFHFA